MTSSTEHRTAIVIGAGIVGASCAYFLSRGGFRVIVLDGGGVAQGATGLASGGVRSQFPWPLETSISLRTQLLWSQFEKDHGVDLNYRQVGYLTIAADPGNARELRRRMSFQTDSQLEFSELDGSAIDKLLPGARVDDVEAAVFTPNDGFASPTDVTNQIITIGRDLGVDVRLYHPVTDVETKGDRVQAVRTAAGDRIECDVVVNAAGLSAPAVGAMVGLDIPVRARRQHQFLTEPIRGLDTRMLPNVLEPGLDLYLRGEGQAVLFGVAEEAEANRSDVTVNWSLVEALGEKLSWRWPRLLDSGISRGWVGCYEVSPDRRAIVGQAHSVEGFYYANGFSGHGFMHGLATAEALVTLISQGSWGLLDLGELSLGRFDFRPKGLPSV